MATQVQAPDGQIIEFPDSMKDPDIEAAMGRLYPSKFGGIPVYGRQSKFGGIPVPDDVPGMERLGGQPPPVPFRALGNGLPAPKPLQGPAPTFGQKTLQNLPLSLAFAPERMLANTPGMPAGMESGRPIDPKRPLLGQDTGQTVDPIRDVKEYGQGLYRALSNPKETFADDPAGTLVNLGSAVAGFGRSGGFSALGEGARAAVRPSTLAASAAGGFAGRHFGPLGAKLGAAVGAATPILQAAAPELHFPGLIREAPARAPQPLPLSRQLGPGPLVAGPVADSSRVNVSTGAPLSYPGPRQLEPGKPIPFASEPQAPVAPLSANPGGSTFSQRLAQVRDQFVKKGWLSEGSNAGEDAAPLTEGPQVNFVQPSSTLANNPRALAAARALQESVSAPSPPGKLARAAQRKIPAPGEKARANL